MLTWLCVSGTLLLVENEEILWSLQVDHQLFALTKHDVTVSHSRTLNPYAAGG